MSNLGAMSCSIKILSIIFRVVKIGEGGGGEGDGKRRGKVREEMSRGGSG